MIGGQTVQRRLVQLELQAVQRRLVRLELHAVQRRLVQVGLFTRASSVRFGIR